MQRRQSGIDISQSGNRLYAGHPGLQRRRRVPAPGSGSRRAHARRGHRIPRSGGERDRGPEHRFRLRRSLSVANHHQHHRGHAGRRVDQSSVHLRAERQERVRYHHRGRAGQLQRHGVPGGCQPGAARPVRPRRASELRLPLAIRQGHRAAQPRGGDQRPHHHAMENRDARPGPEYPVQLRHHPQRGAATRSQALPERRSKPIGSSPAGRCGATSTAWIRRPKGRKR